MTHYSGIKGADGLHYANGMYNKCWPPRILNRRNFTTKLLDTQELVSARTNVIKFVEDQFDTTHILLTEQLVRVVRCYNAPSPYAYGCRNSFGSSHYISFILLGSHCFMYSLLF